MSRVLLVHLIARAGDLPSAHCDRLVRDRNGYSIEWDVPVEHQASPPGNGYSEGASRYADAPSALADWYGFPRQGERQVGRFPRGFSLAQRSARRHS